MKGKRKKKKGKRKKNRQIDDCYNENIISIWLFFGKEQNWRLVKEISYILQFEPFLYVVAVNVYLKLQTKKCNNTWATLASIIGAYFIRSSRGGPHHRRRSVRSSLAFYIPHLTEEKKIININKRTRCNQCGGNLKLQVHPTISPTAKSTSVATLQSEIADCADSRDLHRKLH